jgi:anaerobic selenocysteine-containing dehydrogenase
MRHVGERGDSWWESISWDEAIGQVVSRLAELRGGGQRLTQGQWGFLGYDWECTDCLLSFGVSTLEAW